MFGIAILYIVYAVVLLAGGAMGYSKARSAPSLIAGVVSALLAAVAAVLLSLHHPRSGLGLGILVSLVISIFFVRRYQTTHKAMPAIPVIVLSIVVLLFSLVRLLTGHPAHA